MYFHFFVNVGYYFQWIKRLSVVVKIINILSIILLTKYIKIYCYQIINLAFNSGKNINKFLKKFQYDKILDNYFKNYYIIEV